MTETGSNVRPAGTRISPPGKMDEEQPTTGGLSQFVIQSRWTQLVPLEQLDLSKFPVRLVYENMEQLARRIDRTNGNVNPIMVQLRPTPPYPVIDGGRRVRAITLVNRWRGARRRAREILREYLSTQDRLARASLSEAEFDTLVGEILPSLFGEDPVLPIQQDGVPDDADVEDDMEYVVTPADMEAALMDLGVTVEHDSESVHHIPADQPLGVLATAFDMSDREALAAAYILNTDRQNLDDPDNHHRDEYIAYLVLELGYRQVDIPDLIGQDLAMSTISNIVRTRKKASPLVREMLRTGVLNTTIAKEFVELPHDLQDHLVRKIRPDQLGSISEAIREARQYRGQERAMNRVREFLSENNIHDVELDLSEFIELAQDIITRLFPHGREGWYDVRRSDVEQVLKEMGVTVRPVNLQTLGAPSLAHTTPETGVAADVMPATMADVAPESSESEVPPSHTVVAPPVMDMEVVPRPASQQHTPSPKTCIAFVPAIEQCIFPHMTCTEDCELFIPGRQLDDIVTRCVFCGGQTRLGYEAGEPLGDVETCILEPDAYGLPVASKMRTSHVVHAQCLIDALISAGRLRGETCRECQNAACSVFRALRFQPERVIHVERCGGAQHHRRIPSSELAHRCNMLYAREAIRFREEQGLL